MKWNLVQNLLLGCLFVATANVYATEQAQTQPEKRPTTTQTQISDKQIKHHLIKQSIAGYSGQCACPYSTTKSGRKCGKRSAYVKPGGYEPLCYSEDVTQNHINRYRQHLL